ncbi:iron-siderophore ABC transporter substrate-binding protein [Geodermatophilus sp. YIM 151500]|uniref:ABC transporter substrate-binding protein n=1 Tax=Geodermatophilus sp. YIM 151500 TaxID=2984531 RepID=UPI0021E4E43F|nr:iron-siderophore ABC transporter substrate-binding protein [Geodermatophilus sp. YIM 151500]MCV2491608.1 iron-siderophore ABC transporter substrate-binding protein [Geodermatophilus sp. YIM 151500]
MIRTRTAAVVLAAALPLAACGGAGDAEPAAASGASGASGASADEFPRTVEHAMGSTEIPAEPERVVVLDTGELDSVVALGVTPVGAVTTDVATGFLSYLQEPAEGVEQVGTIGEPDLEAIAALGPDLILSNQVRHEDLYDELAQIAPTVFAEYVGAPWKDNVGLAAEALGMETEADAVLAEYQQAATALGEAIGDPAATTVSPLRFVQGSIRAYSPESFIGTVLGDIGVTLTGFTEGEYPAFTELSPEQLDLADADVVLYSSYGSSGESGADAVVAGPLWSRLSAVQEGRAIPVEDDVFYTGIGPTAASLIVERLSAELG